MHVKVLYEDNHLLIVEKPVNIPVQGDSSKDRDLQEMLKQYIKDKYNKPGNVYLGLIHRLDRPVGGAMVFAKTSKAASRLSDELRRQKIGRKYVAVIHGRPKRKAGRLVDYLWKDRKKNIVKVADRKKNGAKEAILDYRVLDQDGKHSLAEVQLQTGRSHQIRVQMANQGTPLYGDQKYGRHMNKVGQQIALWACRLSVKHPTKDEIISVDCPPPSVHPWNKFQLP